MYAAGLFTICGSVGTKSRFLFSFFSFFFLYVYKKKSRGCWRFVVGLPSIRPSSDDFSITHTNTVNNTRQSSPSRLSSLRPEKKIKEEKKKIREGKKQIIHIYI